MGSYAESLRYQALPYRGVGAALKAINADIATWAPGNEIIEVVEHFSPADADPNFCDGNTVGWDVRYSDHWHATYALAFPYKETALATCWAN